MKLSQRPRPDTWLRVPQVAPLRWQRLRARLASLVVAGLAAWPLTAGAQVRELLSYRHYPVSVEPQGSLTRALSKATPVRPRWWQRFHAMAAWNVSWTYQERVGPAGDCRADDAEVTLVTEITLPELTSAGDAQRKAFDAYLAALTTHELGHHAIAQAAGGKILAGLRDAGVFNDCEALGAHVTSLTGALIQEAKAAEKRYDEDTRYGLTQGATLEP